METASSQGQGRRPKNAPRRNMEARREQNRKASRAYREKRKQKLALLEHLLPEDGIQNSSSTASNIPREGTNPTLDTNGVPQSEDVIPEQLATSHDASNLNIDFSGVDEFINPNDISNSHSQHQPQPLVSESLASFSLPDTSYPSSTQLPDVLFNTVFEPLTAHGSPWQTPLPSGADLARKLDDSFSFPNRGALQNVLKSLELLSISQKETLMKLLQHQIRYATASSTQPPDSHAQHSDEDDSNTFPTFPSNSTRMQLEALEFSLAIRQTATAGPCPAPNDYVMKSGLFSALFANCFALGMADIGPLLIDDGWSIFGLGPEIAYHPSQLCVVRAKFRSLAPALQPCDKQLTFAHHPYIDVIPFKTFRQKILEAIDHDQPLVDEDTLCHDMMAGLVCWGSQRSTLGMEAAVPWDVRSWEPKVWFLHKYADYVGGWDDEMWKGARWWHSMRGERVQLPLAATTVS